MSNYLVVETIDTCLIIRLSRPEIRNPLSVAVIDELRSITDDCAGRSDISKIVFTGTAHVFASGADLREIDLVTEGSARDFALKGQRLMERISKLSQTSVAAINGFCFGGALDLALACTRRVASRNARFAHPGSGLGIITGWGGTQRLPRLIGQPMSYEMFFTAEAIDAARALEIGLIDELTDEPLRSALLFTNDM